MEQIIKIYIDESENITEDIESIKDFVSQNHRMMVYKPEDELEALSSRVQKMHDALVSFKNSGVSWDVFKRYMRGHGISQRDFDHVMSGVEAFFADLNIPIK